MHNTPRSERPTRSCPTSVNPRPLVLRAVEDRLPGPAAVIVASVRHTYETGASFLVPALAYYALTAVMPALLLVFVAAARLGEIEIARGAVRSVGDVLTPRGQAFILASVEDVSDRTGIVVFAAAVALASAVQLFRTLDRAVSLVYGVDPAEPRATLREGTFVVVVGTLGMSAVLFAAGAMSLYASEETRAVATPLVVFVATAAALFPLYYSVPNTTVSVADALPGTLFTAVVWTAVGAVFGLVATHSDGAALYGLLGGLLLVVTWLYLAHFIVVVGAALNVALTDRLGIDGPQ